MKPLSNSIIRILFSIPFLAFGIMHLVAGKETAGLIPEFIPWSILWVYATGVALIAAAISFILNKQAKVAGVLLAVLLLLFIVTIWLPKATNGDQMAVSNLLKDIGLMAGALLVSGISKN
ncbi:DoxX family protein [Bacteroidota bacterium]